MEPVNQLAGKFAEKLAKADGECFLAPGPEEAGKQLINLLKSKGVRTVALYESPLSSALNLRERLTESGVEVHTDHLLPATSHDDVGITEANWGIAELGTLVQIAPEVDHRLCSTLVPIHIALLRTSKILPGLDDILGTLTDLPQMPGFVGFITGPSRSSDIERILEIGVHGPKEVIVILVED